MKTIDKILSYIEEQQAKDRCGVWPFQLGRWFPFTPD